MAACNVFKATITFMCIAAVFLSIVQVSEANYKNAPMNGIMFGKRNVLDYDNRAKTFVAFCEIAVEACQTWFPAQENK